MLTTMASQRDITRETNTRFWISTQYKLGEPLNPADPGDKQMARIWLDIYRDLIRENARGTLVLTHTHASVAQNLRDAIAAYRIERAMPEGDPRYTEARRAKAQALNDAALRQEMIYSEHTRAAHDMARRRVAMSGWPWYEMPY